MIVSSRPVRIEIPARLRRKLQANRELEGGVLSTLASLEPWLEDNKLVFFPEYTDHGPDHIRQVILTASSLIADEGWREVTAEDAALIVLASLLHDSAMHLSEDGFLTLIRSERAPLFADERPWPILWELFLAEASRFDSRKLKALFGDTTPVRRPAADPRDMTRRDRMLIGEFLRRHHPRLAHEFAVYGIAGPGDRPLKLLVNDRFAALAGHVARSHGMPIRAAVDCLPAEDRRTALGSHPAFVMALLRIADYIQVAAERAPTSLLRVRSLSSPVSRGEWRFHETVISVEMTHEDPEALYVKVSPADAAEFVKARRLFASIQRELDESWALLGELYGRFRDLARLALIVRRIRSSIDDAAEFARRVSYVPEQVAFTTAGTDLLKLLIGPLYGQKPSIGLRELLQNAVDAVLELRDYASRHPVDASALPELEADVMVRFHKDARGQWAMTVQDRGIGMTMDVITNYFLRAGASFRNSDAWRAEHTNADGTSRVLRSGRFGIGALAAFLSGDRIAVTTRHVTSPDGLTFQISLDDENVTVWKTPAPIGTNVTVALRQPPSEWDKNRPADWDGTMEYDWYRLTDPSVVIEIDGDRPKRARLFPGIADELPPEWRRIHPEGYRAVDWSYGSGHGFLCNGIKVPGIRFPALNFPDPLYVPALSIFDPDGNLPLNLQRSDLVAALSFGDELYMDIVRDAIAFTALHAPEDATRVLTDDLREHHYRGFKPGVSLCASPYGWQLNGAYDGAVEVEVLFPRRGRRRRGVGESVNIANARLTPLEPRPGSTWSSREFCKELLLYARDDRSWRLFVPRHVYDERREELNAVPERIGDWWLFEHRARFPNAVDFERFAAGMDVEADKIDALVERPCPAPENSWTKGYKVWVAILREYYDVGAIPYSRQARRRLLDSELMRPYVERHRAIAAGRPA